MAIGALAGISMAMQAIPAITGLIQGGKQKREGEALAASLNRPDYKIPSAFEEALSIQRDMVAPQALPGMGFTEQQIRSTTGEGVRSLEELSSDPASLLQVALQLYSNQQENLSGLGAQQSQFMTQQKMGQTARLQDMLGQKARYQEREFEINEFEPYMEAARAAAALRGAGMQNMQGATQALASGVGNLTSDIMQMNMYEKYLSGNQGGGTPANGLQQASGYLPQSSGQAPTQSQPSNNMFQGGLNSNMFEGLDVLGLLGNLGFNLNK